MLYLYLYNPIFVNTPYKPSRTEQRIRCKPNFVTSRFVIAKVYFICRIENRSRRKHSRSICQQRACTLRLIVMLACSLVALSLTINFF